VGLSLAWLGTTLMQAPFTVDAGIVLLAFSTLIGVVFGYFPRPSGRAAEPNRGADA
jgi:hypothetical protein